MAQPPKPAEGLKKDPDARKKAAALRVAKRNLHNFRTKQTEYFLKVAAEIQTLREALAEYGDFDVQSWLKGNLGFSTKEAKIASDIHSDLFLEKASLIKLGTAPETIYALSSCDEGFRRETIKRLKRGETLNRSTIKKMRRDEVYRSATGDQIALLRRRELLERAGDQAGVALVARFQRQARKLLELYDIAVAANGHWDRHADRNDAPANVRKVARKAAYVLSLYSDLFGPSSREEFLDPNFAASEDYVAKVSFDVARQTVYELKSGGDRFPVRPFSDLERSIRRHLQFLAGEVPMAVAYEVAKGLDRKEWLGPTFIDIDAGVGGMALGLVAAGFRPTSIFARTTDAELAINSNKLLRNVSEVRQGEFGVAIKRLAGSEPDLLTCGIPWHEYHHGDANQAFKNAFEAVVQLKPKAFIFEARSEKSDGDRAKLFDVHGYDVAWHMIDGSEFGLAQAKVRSLMIGSRDGYLKDFVMPSLRVPRTAYLSDVIGDLIGGHVWTGPVSPEAKSEYEELLDKKRSKLVKEHAPPFLNPFEFRHKQKWKDLGIDVVGFVSDPPSLSELGRADGFHLSTAMVKRIQSFPDDWMVESPFNTNAETVADAFPPVLAKMMGLAIHSALLGIEFDYDRARGRHLVGITDEDPKKRPVWEIPHPRYAVASTNASFDLPRRRGLAAKHPGNTRAPPSTNDAAS